MFESMSAAHNPSKDANFFKSFGDINPSDLKTLEEVDEAIKVMKAQIEQDGVISADSLLDTTGHDSGFGSLDDSHAETLQKLLARRAELTGETKDAPLTQ